MSREETNALGADSAAGGAKGGVAVRVLVQALRVYQRYVSPAIGCHCRFHPTCSRYAVAAVKRHGPWRGALLATLRLLRCHPLHPGGYDPVPEAPRS